MRIEYEKLIRSNLKEMEDKTRIMESKHREEVSNYDRRIEQLRLQLFRLVFTKSELERLRNNRAKTDINFLNYNN